MAASKAGKQPIKMTDEQKALFDALTPLQQEVSLNSIKGMNDIDAYKNSSGKAKKLQTMEVTVSRMLSNAKVKAFISSMKEVAVSDAVMSCQEMKERLSNLARTDMNDLVEWQEVDSKDDEGNEFTQSMWRVKPSVMQDKVAMSSISELAATKDGIKIKQHSPLAAMKQLADLAGYEAPKKVDVDLTTTTFDIDVTATPEEAARLYTEMMEG